MKLTQFRCHATKPIKFCDYSHRSPKQAMSTNGDKTIESHVTSINLNASDDLDMVDVEAPDESLKTNNPETVTKVHVKKSNNGNKPKLIFSDHSLRR